MINYKFVLRPIRNNDKLFIVALRITENRKSVFIYTQINTSKKYWNENKQELKGNDERNIVIKGYKKRISKIIFDNEANDLNLTARDVKSRLTQREDITFNEFIEDELKLMDIAPHTLKNYKSQLTKINNYNNHILFKNINLDFIEKYNYWRRSGDLKENTITKDMTVLRTFVNLARKKGHIKTNPFEHFKLKGYVSNREYLSDNELKSIEALMYDYEIKPGTLNVLSYFLFACYTGLRYQDIKDLKHTNISENLISIEMHKTKLRVSIPIIDKAQALIPEHTNDNEKVFKVFSNQVTNRHLKEIASLTGITKPISFHVARHTFATLALTYGIPINIVSQLLGHTSIKQTQIYAKIIDQVKIDYMKKLNAR